MTLLLLLACHCRRDEEPERVVPDPYQPPNIVGPLPMGYGSLEIEGDDGPEVMPLWFPAEEEGSQLASYGELGEGEATTDVSADCSTKRPVVVFSHASGGLPLQSAFLGERLSSFGYVSVAPRHVGNTRDDMDVSSLAASVLNRPSEIADAYDALVTAEGPLADCLDAEAGYAVVGHDLGGVSALLLGGLTLEMDSLDADCQGGDSLSCQILDLSLDQDTGGSLSLADDRVWAVIAMAPTSLAVDAGGLESARAPTAIFGGVQDTSVDWDEVITPLMDRLGSDPLGLGSFDGAGHASFTELCPIYPQWSECQGAPYRTPEEVHALIDATAVPFLETMRGEDRAAHYLPPDEDGVSWMWARGGD